MSTLLVKLVGNMSFNRTIFPPKLFVYDEIIVYSKRYLFKVREISISYNQVSQVNVIHGIIFSQIDIITTGAEDIIVKFVSKKLAKQAKKVIDQKLFQAHAKHKPDEKAPQGDVEKVEKSLDRLNELVNRGLISQKDYNKKRSELFNNLK